MYNDNRAFIVTGYGAAKLMASGLVKSVRPGGKRIDPFPHIKWEDASEEVRKDPKVIWITTNGKDKHTFRKHTPEEKEEIRLNEVWRIEETLKVLLNKYGWEYAEKYAQENQDKIDKYGIKVNLCVPHCEYVNGHQCDLFCPFFKGYCDYKEET